MKLISKYLLLLILILAYRDGFSQDTAALHRVKDLDLSFYLEIPTYIVNKDYVLYEYEKDRKIIYADMQSFKQPRYNPESGLALDKYGIYFQGRLFKIDTTGFKIVGRSNTVPIEWLWKNRDRVYKDTTQLIGADAASFESLECFNGLYFKDKNYLYYFDKRIENSDPATVNRSCDIFCYDKDNIYLNGKIWYFDTNERYLPVNNEIIKTSKFAIEISNTSAHGNLIVKGMDAQSLKGLSRWYSIDKSHVFFDTVALPIKPENFKNIKIWDQVNRAFITDGIHVYYGSELQPDLDAKSFGMFPKSDFCYDKNGAYQRADFGNKKFPFKYSKQVNEKNMVRTNSGYYFIYAHQAYNPWDDKLYNNLSDSDILKLKMDWYFILNGKVPLRIGYYKIGSKLHYRDIRTDVEIKNVDAQTVGYIGQWYIKDKDHVYTRTSGDIVEFADPVSFASFTNDFYKDKNNLYFGKQKLIGSTSIQLLAIFRGDRSWHGDEGDGGTPDFDHYLFKNDTGFWFVTNKYNPIITYLGKTFNPKWNKAFENLELPAGL
jgi:hypothetical protein